MPFAATVSTLQKSPEIIMITVSIIAVICITVLDGQCITGNDIAKGTCHDPTKNLIEGSTQFGLHLLKTINNHTLSNLDPKNLFFSPFSVWSSLVVAYMYMAGQTEEEVKSLLGLGNSDTLCTLDAFHKLLNFDFAQSPDKAMISYQMANKIFLQQGTTCKEARVLSQEVSFLNFANQPEQSRVFVNEWAKKKTNNRIIDILPEGSIDHKTVMVIANAIYFKGEWNEKFETYLTRREPFGVQVQDQSKIYVAMMYTTGRFKHGESEELQCSALELPYKGLAMSMVLLLPNNRHTGLDILVNRLTPESLRNLSKSMSQKEVDVAIPKIKMESSFDLTSVLYDMGFSFFGDPNTAIYHKAFIEVNEEGTEATAATGIIQWISTNGRGFTPNFRADRPFVYLIRENMSGTILFIGTVQKPEEYSEQRFQKEYPKQHQEPEEFRQFRKI